MKNQKLQINARAESGTAKIRITDRITDYSDTTSAHAVKKIVDELIKQGIVKAEVYINSSGGSVFTATEIANELKRFEKVKLTVGALAASAATYLVAKYPASAFSNSQFMIHKPKLSTFGDVNQVQADLKLLKNLTNDYKKTYAEKMKKTGDEIEELWKDGDYWMTAEEALALGLIDNIIPEEEKATAESVAILEACGAPHIPAIQVQKQDLNTMDRKELIASLGLSADATDEQITQKIAENRQLAEEAAQAKAQAEAGKKINAQNLVQQAVKDKKITAEHAAQYEALAGADYESTKTILDSMPIIQALSTQLTPSVFQAADTSRASWTLEDYLEKDPQALYTLEKEDPEAFIKLNDAYYGA